MKRVFGYHLTVAALVLSLVTCTARAQLSGGCVTNQQLLGDCVPAGSCSAEPTASVGSCRAGNVCCTRVTAAPEGGSSSPGVDRVPPSGALVFSGPAELPQKGRRTLRKPNFACGGERGRSGRRRRQTEEKRPFVVGGSPASGDIATAVGVVSTRAASRPSLNSILDRVAPRAPASRPAPPRPAPSPPGAPAGPSRSRTAGAAPPPPRASGGGGGGSREAARGGFPSLTPFSSAPRRPSQNSIFSPSRQSRRPPSNRAFNDEYQNSRGVSYRPRANGPGNVFQWLSRGLANLFAPLFGNNRHQRSFNRRTPRSFYTPGHHYRGRGYGRRRSFSPPGWHAFSQRGGRPSHSRRHRWGRYRRSPSPQNAAADQHFETLWREYQSRVRSGQAEGGITRAQLREAYQAASQEQEQEQQQQRGWTCGSVLISERHMLTAAHCLKAGRPEVVRLGDRVLNSTEDEGAPAEYRVVRVIPHPDYSGSRFYHDLALLELDRRVQFGRHVQPFCLFDGRTSLVDRVGYVAGWGATEYGGDTVNTLMGGNLTIWARDRCQRAYQDKPGFWHRLPEGITQNVICAGGGIRDACQGDSGGPMTVRTEQGTRLVGVVAAGIGCATPGVPGLYTNVVPYIDWIDSIVYGEE